MTVENKINSHQPSALTTIWGQTVQTPVEYILNPRVMRWAAFDSSACSVRMELWLNSFFTRRMIASSETAACCSERPTASPRSSHRRSDSLRWQQSNWKVLRLTRWSLIVHLDPSAPLNSSRLDNKELKCWMWQKVQTSFLKTWTALHSAAKSTLNLLRL